MSHDNPRAETGAIQFGTDWPGLFIRGDHIIAMLPALRKLIGEPEEVAGRIGELDDNTIDGMLAHMEGIAAMRPGTIQRMEEFRQASIDWKQSNPVTLQDVENEPV